MKQLSALLLGIHDPFIPFENLFCAVFFGGVWDSMQRAVSGPAKNADASKSDASKASKPRLPVSEDGVTHAHKKSD